MVEISNKIICITGGNLIEIKKTIKILNEIENKEKIKIIYNKKNEYTISKKFLKIIFLKNKLIGTIKFNNSFNKIINKNLKKIYINKNTKKEIKRIARKIIKK